MDTVENKTRKKWNWELILGIFFLIPPIIGVLLLFAAYYGGTIPVLLVI